MKDVLGNELKVGDKIVYCTRRSSWMDLKATTILEFKTKENWQGQQYEVAVCTNPGRVEAEERGYSWAKNCPKTVSLGCPGYIARVA